MSHLCDLLLLSSLLSFLSFFFFFFFNDTATPEIYTLSLHDALPISFLPARRNRVFCEQLVEGQPGRGPALVRVGAEEPAGRLAPSRPDHQRDLPGLGEVALVDPDVVLQQRHGERRVRVVPADQVAVR